MFDFIWTMRKSVTLDPQHSNMESLDALDAFLRREDKRNIHRSVNGISYREPFFHFCGRNWLAMVVFDEGNFVITSDLETRRLSYELSSYKGFLFCAFAALVFFAVICIGNGVLIGVKAGLFSFAWVYGMNMFLAYIRVPRAIRRALRRS